tara:strand:+ start:526 stop:741 length:216 start_codon:yes stop_codon:yes gene_type:complete
MPRKPKRPKNNVLLGLKSFGGNGKVYYVSSVDTEIFREEWATNRIIELLDEARNAEAKAVAFEHDIEWLDI